jgi:hypothetical protein
MSARDTNVIAGYETSRLKITELSKQIMVIKKKTTDLNNFMVS